MDGSKPKMPKKSDKIIKDSVHGTIVLPEKVVEIIDTLQFQRLRNVKQLGTCYYVYPGASHNRFEHCIGTSHMAGKFLETIKRNQPELEIDDYEIECVQIAGLCHDLGHGPFSHLFDHMFDKKLSHEEVSCKMFKYLLETNNIELHPDMIKMVERMIVPPKLEASFGDGVKITEKGKNVEVDDLVHLKERRFLYQIVCNDESKFDVDKWDYFERDCHHLGLKNNFDHDRFMQLCRVLEHPEIPGCKVLCVSEKEELNVFEMFHTRRMLHERAYKHKVTSTLNAMISDAMELANDQVFVGGSKMSEIVTETDVNEEAFTQFDDSIFFRILHYKKGEVGEKLQKAQEILKGIHSRKLYKTIGCIREKSKVEEKNLRSLLEEEEMLSREDYKIDSVSFDYGDNEGNPCRKIWFYFKDDLEKAFKITKKKNSEMLPKLFKEYELRLICKSKYTEKEKLLKKIFDKFCEEAKQ